jgi:hypothetical protein
MLRARDVVLLKALSSRLPQWVLTSSFILCAPVLMPLFAAVRSEQLREAQGPRDGPVSFISLSVSRPILPLFRSRYLSFWNLMSSVAVFLRPPIPILIFMPDRYDYAGSWDTLANHQATLFDDGSLNALSTDRAIKYFTSNGVPVGKLVVGIPLYGRSFLETKGPGRPFNGIGKGSWEKGSPARAPAFSSSGPNHC